MTETVKCVAIACFTQFVPEYGMIHGDPDSSDKKAKEPIVPDHVIARLVENGFIKAPKGFVDPNAPADESTNEAPAS